MALPTYRHATARPHRGVIRIDLDTASKVVGFSCTLSPDVADKLADELRAAANITRIEVHASKVSANASSATERVEKSPLCSTARAAMCVRTERCSASTLKPAIISDSNSIVATQQIAVWGIWCEPPAGDVESAGWLNAHEGWPHGGEQFDSLEEAARHIRLTRWKTSGWTYTPRRMK